MGDMSAKKAQAGTISGLHIQTCCRTGQACCQKARRAGRSRTQYVWHLQLCHSWWLWLQAPYKLVMQLDAHTMPPTTTSSGCTDLPKPARLLQGRRLVCLRMQTLARRPLCCSSGSTVLSAWKHPPTQVRYSHHLHGPLSSSARSALQPCKAASCLLVLCWLFSTVALARC